MKKIFLTLGLAVFTASIVSAQPANNFHNSQIGTYERVTKHGPYLTGKFFDNTFIGVAGGVTLYNYSIDGSKKPGLGDRIAPALDVNLGKWLTPTTGIRLGYSGMKLNALNVLVEGGDDVLHELKFMHFHGDLLFNLSNALAGYREDRFWDLVPYVGAGYARGWNENKEVNSHKLTATAGLLNNFQLGHRVDLTLEGRWMATDRMFDGIHVGSKFDQVFAVTAGLTLKFGPQGGFKRPVYQEPVDVAGYESRIKALEGDVARDRATIDRLNRELEASKRVPANVVEVETKPVAISAYFDLGKAVVRQNDMANLKTLSDVIKDNPNRKFNVMGYADAGTGSKELNQKLSEQRAKNVADVLVKNGVNRSQLVIKGMGGVNTHHGSPFLDRVVVTE